MGIYKFAESNESSETKHRYHTQRRTPGHTFAKAKSMGQDKLPEPDDFSSSLEGLRMCHIGPQPVLSGLI